MSKLITIGQLSQILGLVNASTNKPLNHVLRYWEKEIKQIRPRIINKRRFYSEKQVELIKLIKFLLKEKGMTINGVKSVLNSDLNKLDDYKTYSLKADYYKSKIKFKSKKILDKINKLKNSGKKNAY